MKMSVSLSPARSWPSLGWPLGIFSCHYTSLACSSLWSHKVTHMRSSRPLKFRLSVLPICS